MITKALLLLILHRHGVTNQQLHSPTCRHAINHYLGSDRVAPIQGHGRAVRRVIFICKQGQTFHRH